MLWRFRIYGHSKALFVAAIFVACAIPHLQAAQGQDDIDQDANGNPAPPDYVKVVLERPRTTFLALKDPGTAAAKDVVQLYHQGANVSAAAYLFFGGAEPLSQVNGSSAALLPYLSPTILRLYASQPERCASDLVRRLYDLSIDLYGTETLQACHYTLYKALQATFAWVRDNIALRLQQVDGQPLATAAWPDLSLYPDLKLAAAVYGALSAGGTLGTTGDVLEERCGLGRGAFAALVPRISAALEGLHGDLQVLQSIAEDAHFAHWISEEGGGLYGEDDDGEEEEEGEAYQGEEQQADSSSSSSGGDSSKGSSEWQRINVRRAAKETGGSLGGMFAVEGFWAQSGNEGNPQKRHAAVDGREGQDEDDGGDRVSATYEGSTKRNSARLTGLRRRRLWRRRLAATPDNFFYYMPPAEFKVAPPADMPRLYLPLVFHIMLYKDRTGAIAPTYYAFAGSYAQRIVTIANYMSNPANVKFFIKEVRNDPVTYPYLLLADRMAWLTCPTGGLLGNACLSNDTFVASTVVDFPRSINIYVVSDSTAGMSVPLGYAWVPGSDFLAGQGHVFLSWDSLSIFGSNSPSVYHDGANTLTHEIFHHLGLRHTFNPSSNPSGCTADDYVLDTPTTLGYASRASFATTSTSYCMELFWGQYGGDWPATYDRWSATLGIPETDMNAWADSCPTRAGYDELGNYMTYNTPVCFAALGHFTPGQAQLAHYTTAELNPVLYAWGQYYAQISPPPPPNYSPHVDVYNHSCKVTRSGCQCKSAWTFNDIQYSYCDRPASDNTLSCEVQWPAFCAACSTTNQTAQCVLPCTGTARTCRRPPYPGTNMPPPPPPRPPSPPPMPPPPPPLSVPDLCKVSTTGCACRSTWMYGNYFYSFCSSPDGSGVLFCQVDPSCPGFSIDYPYQDCDSGLTSSICRGGRVHLSSSYLAPGVPYRPPLPPLAPPPPPSPSSGAVARVTGAIAVRGNCSAPGADSANLEAALVGALARAAQVASGFVVLTGARCSGSSSPPAFTTNLIIFFPAGSTAHQIGNMIQGLANTTALRGIIGPVFEKSYGEVSQTSYTGVAILQRLQVVSIGPHYIQRLSQYDSGLVEMMLPDGSMGLVCANNFTDIDASRICQNLGFSSGLPWAASVNGSYQSALYLNGTPCALTADGAPPGTCSSTGSWAAANSQCNLTRAAGVQCRGDVVAVVDASLALNTTDCNFTTGVGSGLLVQELFDTLSSTLYNFSAHTLVLRSRLTCNRVNGILLLRISYSIMLRYGKGAFQVDEAENRSRDTEAVRSALGSIVQDRWGPLTSAAAAGVYILQRTELCRSAADKESRVCAESASGSSSSSNSSSSSPSGLDRKVPGTALTNRQLIAICASIVGFLLLVVVVLACILFRRRRDHARVTPTQRTAAWVDGGAGPGGGAVTAAPATTGAANAAPPARGSDAGADTPLVPVATTAVTPLSPHPGPLLGALPGQSPEGPSGGARDCDNGIAPATVGPNAAGRTTSRAERSGFELLQAPPQQPRQQPQELRDATDRVRLFGDVNATDSERASTLLPTQVLGAGGSGGGKDAEDSVAGSDNSPSGGGGGSSSLQRRTSTGGGTRAVAALSPPQDGSAAESVGLAPSLPLSDQFRPSRLPPLPSLSPPASEADPRDATTGAARAPGGNTVPFRRSVGDEAGEASLAARRASEGVKNSGSGVSNTSSRDGDGLAAPLAVASPAGQSLRGSPVLGAS